MEELPTMDFLKSTKPKVYDNSWNCPFCHNNETFNHVWTCNHHIVLFNDIVSHTKAKLLECLKAVVNNFSVDNLCYQQIISHGSWWVVAYEPIHITFIDLIKGIVPFELSNLINDITNNKDATLEILRHMYGYIYNLTQDVWLDRCKLVVQEELRRNISGKSKNKSQFGANNFERSSYVDVSTYSSMTKIIISPESLIDKMVTRGCHFSNFKWVMISYFPSVLVTFLALDLGRVRMVEGR
jgi:hypothetical protein